jgi:ABC-type polysaccharide/polyol phosphate transport system ATPase subunit
MENIVEFNGVTKVYYHGGGRMLLRNRIQEWIAGKRPESFAAVKNISFVLKRGESMAVVGSNGAGKSTLLSLVAGLSRPNAGSIAVNGRIAALLELGSGFHPDLTGTENVTLNASLLGLSRKRTAQLFHQIVEFSGIGHEFIDEPLRTYSTGMVMRLAFSVAINMDPDVLLVDEVLAVGDADFQQKCFQKIREFRHSGKSLLCVSHATGMVQELCDKAIWLDHGEIVMSGAINDVMEAYNGRRAIAV